MASTISDHGSEIRPVVILGASGRLGTMVRKCWPKGTPLVCHSTQDLPEFLVFDLILDADRAAQAMAGAGAVICLSGVTDARARARGDVYSRNTDLALAALRAAHQAGAGRVLLTSSAAVYGAAGGVLDEGTTPAPVSDYGRAKLEMERAALREARTLGHPVTALRIGNVAGADAILGGWHSGMRIDQLPGGCTPRRSYIGPVTLARTLHDLCWAADLPDVLNVAARGTVEMGALLDAAGLPWTPREPDGPVIADVTLSTEALEKYVTLAPESGTAAHLVAEWREGAGT